MPRNLSPCEKAFLRLQGYNPNNFLRSSKSPYDYEFIEKGTNKKLTLRR